MADTNQPLNHLLRDTTSFESLFRSEYTALVTAAYRILNDKARAEDVVQDVFLKLWHRREEINVNENLPAYLHRAVVNHAINIYKQQYRKLIEHTEDIATKSDAGSTPADAGLTTGELNHKIERALATMSDSSRGVFMLSRFEEMSYKEIAEKLQISVKTVEKHMSSALRHLRNYLPLMILAGAKIFFAFAVGCLPFLLSV